MRAFTAPRRGRLRKFIGRKRREQPIRRSTQAEQNRPALGQSVVDPRDPSPATNKPASHAEKKTANEPDWQRKHYRLQAALGVLGPLELWGRRCWSRPGPYSRCAVAVGVAVAVGRGVDVGVVVAVATTVPIPRKY